MHVVSGLWVENTLTRIERLCIQSFLDHGHEVQVFTYADRLDGLPSGARMIDGREILPETALFMTRNQGSWATFSDLFRFTLLHKHGGTWIDMDIICLRPLPDDRRLLIHEAEASGQGLIGSQIMRLEAGDPLTTKLLEHASAKDTADFGFFEIGPWLVHTIVTQLGYTDDIKPHSFANPLTSSEWFKAWLPEFGDLLGTLDANLEVHAIHLWNELLRLNAVSKSASLAPDSAIAQLLARHGIAASTGVQADALGQTARTIARIAWAQSFPEADPQAQQDRLARILIQDPQNPLGYTAMIRMSEAATHAALDYLDRPDTETPADLAFWLTLTRALVRAERQAVLPRVRAPLRAAAPQASASQFLELIKLTRRAFAPREHRRLLKTAPNHLTPADCDRASPQGGEAAFVLARGLHLLDRSEEALQWAVNAAEAAPKAPALLLLAEVLVATADPAAARAAATKALAAAPGNAKAARLIARLPPPE